MIKCIVIDDEVTICEEIEQKIKNWSKIASQNVEVIVLNSGNDIAWSRLKEIDIVFLDVELKDEENGVDIARKLRTNNYTGEIVFLTAFSEYEIGRAHV